MERVSEVLKFILSMVEIELPEVSPPRISGDLFREARKKIEKATEITEEFQKIIGEWRECREQYEREEVRYSFAQLISNYLCPTGREIGYGYMALYGEGMEEGILRVVEATGGYCAVLKAGEGTSPSSLIIFLKRDEVKVKSVVEALDVKHFKITLEDVENIEILRNETEKLRRRLENIEQRIIEKTLKSGTQLYVLFTELSILNQRVRILSRSKLRPGIYVVSGWIPRRRLNELNEKLSLVSGGYIVVEEADTIERPPTLIHTPKPIVPFFKLVEAYGLPESKEINPTIFLAITFPLFFGIMFGDVGQGAVIALVGLLLRKVKLTGFLSMFNEYATLFISLGIASTLFGFMYGSIFGPGRLPALWVEPLEYPNGIYTIILVSLVIGVIHVSFGILLNVFNHLSLRDYIGGFKATMWLLFYLIFTSPILLKAIGSLKESLLDSYLKPTFLEVMVLPLVLMILVPLVWEWRRRGLLRAFGETQELIMEVFEATLQSIGHTISYLRLWALNIAHESFMEVFLRIASIGYSINLVFGILIEGVGNILVMILEGIVAFMHVLRLHWVEWFMKFYGGSGYRFRAYEERLPVLKFK